MALKKYSRRKENFTILNKYEAFYTGGYVQFSKDGQNMLCCCNKQVKIVNIETGKVIETIGTDDDEELTTFILADDDKTLVTAAKNGILKHYDITEKSPKKIWKSVHFGPISCMSFSPTTTLLATGGSDSRIKVWNIKQQCYTHNLKGAQGVFSIVHFHPISSHLLFGAANDYKIRVWNLNNSQCTAVLEGHYSAVTSIDFTECGSQMISSSRDQVILLWDIDDFRLLKTIPVYEAVESVILCPEKRLLPNLKVVNEDMHFITAGEKGVLRVWHALSGKCVYTQENSSITLPEDSQYKEPQITQTVYSSVHDTINVITHEHNIIMYKLQDFSLSKQFVGYNDDILDVQLMGENNSHLAVATNSPSIKVFELSTFNCQLLNGHKEIVVALDVFPKDQYLLISCSKDATVRGWRMDPDSGKIDCMFIGTGHTAEVGAVSCCRHSMQFFLSGAKDSTLKLWQIPDKIVAPMMLSASFTVKSHDKSTNSIAVSPNDKLIATGSQDKTAKIWSASNLKLLGTIRGHRKGIWCVKFSPVDQVLATASADGTIKIWAVADFSCIKTFEGHESSVLKIIFISQGTQLVSSSSNGMLKLWDIKMNETIKTFNAHEDQAWALTVTEKEDFLVSGGADSTIVIWKDVTEEERIEKMEKEENVVLQEQKLSNLVHQKKWLKALGLGITLEQPFRVLNIIREILIEDSGKSALQDTIAKLRQDQIEALLRFAVEWNTNSKNCYPAQLVVNTVLTMYTPEELLKLSDIRANIQAILPYTERHFQRLNRLLQQATFIEFLWQNVKVAHEESMEEDS